MELHNNSAYSAMPIKRLADISTRQLCAIFAHPAPSSNTAPKNPCGNFSYYPESKRDASVIWHDPNFRTPMIQVR
jgi:hypothetical protein